MSHYEERGFWEIEPEIGIKAQTERRLVAAAIIAGAAGLGAAGLQYAGAQSASSAASKAAKQAQNAPIPSYNPAADPLVSGISLEALLGLGRGDAGVATQSSPLTQVLNAMNQSGSFSRQEAAGVELWLPGIAETGEMPAMHGNSGDYRKAFAAVQKALALAGYSSPTAFSQAYQSQKAESAAWEARMAPVREQILSGRIAAYGNISQLAKDFPGATLSDINALAKQYEDQTRASIGQDVADQRAAILQSANVARGNPAATLGRLAQQQLLSTQAAPTTALERALAMLQGRQALGANAIAANQAVLDPGNTLSYNVANLRSNAALNALQLMTQQQTQNNALQAGLTTAAGNATGAGLASAGNALASAAGSYLSAQQFSQLLNMYKSQPTGGPASQPTVQSTGQYIYPSIP